MELTKEQKEEARKRFNHDIKDIDSNDVEYATKKGKATIEKYDANPPGALLKLWNDIKLMISLIYDFTRGEYSQVPWNVIAAITGAIVYFVSPIDIIPDFIPVVGYLDDAMVIKLALEIASTDLNQYSKWKKTKQLEIA